MPLALERELFAVFVRGLDLAQQVLGELVLEDRMGKLFQQDWREVYVRPDSQAFLLQLVEDPQQRKIGLRCRQSGDGASAWLAHRH